MILMLVLSISSVAAESEIPEVAEPVEAEPSMDLIEMEVQDARGDVVRVAVPYASTTPSYGVGTS